MATDKHNHDNSNVIDIFTGLDLDNKANQRIIRISPEPDGICMLYSNNTNPDKLFSMKLVCWSLSLDGTIDGMVPWLDGLRSCDSLQDQDIGQWEGYYDPRTDDMFFEPPEHKILELSSAADFFSGQQLNESESIQEIADTIGTHALFIDPLKSNITLSEVVSWRLNKDGRFNAMLIDQDQITSTPVLPGDQCLYAAEQHPEFHYFFQHHVANQIKSEDPRAMTAVAMLLDS